MTQPLDAIHDMLRALLPFEWSRPAFMLNALLVILPLAPLCGALGAKVVTFRMAFFSDAISHSAFTGVVLGYLLVPVARSAAPGFEYWDALLPPLAVSLFGLLVGIGITAARRRSDLSSDTVIGVFFAAVIAVGIAVISRNNLRSDFERYLYGTILAARPADVLVTLLLALVGLAFLARGFNALLLIGLNESLARSQGIRTRAYDYLFASLVALVVTLSIRVVGLLLVTAMLVVPAAAARNIARSAAGLLGWSALIGLVSGVGGLISSFYIKTAAGAMIVLFATIAFILSFASPILRRSAG